jgi:putative tricarboxylic transport membrane protein
MTGEVMALVLANFFTIDTLVGLFVGVVGGIVIGALPGLSATMGVALLIPVTYGMRPHAALIMLTALYTSAVYGGSISAILIHTPGTPASAATALDGYKMTQKGQALQAMGMATTASVFGGFCSALALALIAPPLARISLKFGAPEYFLIALFGLTIIGSLAGNSMLKGLLAGAMGLMFGLIGMSPGVYARYIFNNPKLMSGINIIPAMIGLFSLSQVLIQSEKRGEEKSKRELAKIEGRFLPTWKHWIEMMPLLVRCTLLGIFIGILPGAGGDIASWVGYNEAKRSAKNKELVGTGVLEGVAGPESANNAVTGGALIPLLTLGIPGSATAAVLLGGLTIHGLQPGWQLFSKFADITYTVIAGFFVANIAMGFVGWAIGKHVVKVSNIPTAILMPCIVVFSVFGSFAVNNNMTNVWVMFVFGIIGYFLRKYGVPTAPIVLAIILGPMADNNLYALMKMTSKHPVVYILSRPLCQGIAVLILLGLFAPVFSMVMAKRAEKIYGKRDPLPESNADDIE